MVQQWTPWRKTAFEPVDPTPAPLLVIRHPSPVEALFSFGALSFARSDSVAFRGFVTVLGFRGSFIQPRTVGRRGGQVFVVLRREVEDESVRISR